MTEALVDYARKEFLVRLAQIENVGGREALDIAIEGHLQAIVIYLTGRHGRQEAFDIVSRHADRIIKPLLDEKAGRARR